MPYNLAIRGHDLSTQFAIETLAAEIQKMGISNVQLALPLSFPTVSSDAGNLSPGFGTYVKRIFDQSQIQIAVLSCYINMIHPDLATREAALQKFESYIRHAKYFGAPIVATETGNVFETIHYTEENFTDEAFEQVVAAVQRLMATAERHHTIIGIEPGRNHPIYSIERMAALLEKIDSDYLGVILDATNLISVDNYLKQKKLVSQAFESFGDKIVAIHLKDFVIEKGEIVPTNIGQGLMDVGGILTIINQYKPYLNIVMEETKDEAIIRARKLINGEDK